MNLAVFASGNGSNFTAIAKAVRAKRIRVKSFVLICDQPKAFVIKRAQKAKIPVILVRRQDFANRADFEAAIIQRLKYYQINVIALAGFMRMLSPSFIRLYRNRILNIHPSLLPAFIGGTAIKDAWEAHVSVTGVTIHFVDEEMDHGPVILQGKVAIKKKDSLAALEKRVHILEHQLYPRAIKLFAEGKIKVKNGKVLLKDQEN